MLVRDAMTKDPVTVNPETSVFRAWKVMQDRQVDNLPVLEGRRLVGMVTDPDLRLVLPSPATALDAREISYLLDTLPVSEVMAETVTTTTPSTPLRVAARLLLRAGVRALPVMEGDRLVGILTRSDVLASFLGASAPALQRAA